MLDLFCIQGLFATDTLYSFIFPLPVDESNQGSKRFLVESHGKPFQRLDVLNRCRSSLPLRSVISRTGRTQIISGLALAPHSYGELIDNWRSEDDLSDVLLGGTKDTRSSLYCCRVGEVGFVICTCRYVIRGVLVKILESHKEVSNHEYLFVCTSKLPLNTDWLINGSTHNLTDCWTN